MRKLLLLVTVAFALPASAQAPRQACLRAHEIQKSDAAPDEKSIRFVMLHGEQWNVAFKSRCSEVRANGFSWMLAGNDEVCEGQPLKVNGLGGSICVLGKFSKLGA